MSEQKETARTFEEIQSAVTELEKLKTRYGVWKDEHPPTSENDVAKEILYILAKYNTPASRAERILEKAKELANSYAILITR